MAQASFVIVEVAECATMVEIEGVIWYHVGSYPFSPEMGENKMGSTPRQVCCPFTVQMNGRLDVRGARTSARVALVSDT